MERMWLRRATTSAAGAAGLALLSLPSAAVCERGSYTACASTACSSKEEFLAMMSKVQAQRTKAVDSPREAAEAQAGPVPDMSLCPPDRAELGFHSWQLVRAEQFWGTLCRVAFRCETRRQLPSFAAAALPGRTLSGSADSEGASCRTRNPHGAGTAVPLPPLCSTPAGASREAPSHVSACHARN